MTVYSAMKLTFDPDWVMVAHAHPGFTQIIVLRAGAIDVRFDDGETVRVIAGQSVLYAPGRAHGERSASRRRIDMVCLAILGGGSEPVLAHDPRGRVADLASWMTELGPTRDPTAQARLDALGHALIELRRGQALPGPGTGDTLEAAVRRQLLDRLAEPVTLASLADTAGLSPFHFARRFRAETGESPMAYVRRHRVEAARAILMTSRAPLKSVARATGFRDEYHLSRVFKHLTGHPPSSARAD